MGIGSVKAPGGAMDRQREAVRREKAVQQGSAAQPVDAVSRNIQNEISEVQRQKQGLSSKREMPADERSQKQQELQHELSTLNTRLRQRQTEIRKGQKSEGRSDELPAEDAYVQKSRPQVAEESKAVPVEETAEKKGTEKSPDAEEKKENVQTVSRKEDKDKDAQPGGIDFSRDELHSIAAGSIAKEQTRRRDAVIARMEGGIVILRGEIRQDELRGGNADRKRDELKTRQDKMRNAAAGIPAIKAPSAKKEESGQNAGRIKAEAEAGEVRKSRDGVVVVTHNAPWNQIG